MFKSLFLILSFLFTSSVFAQGKFVTIEVDSARIVNIKGEIAGNSIAIAGKIEKLADGTGGPINLIITSPGGSVAMGAQILSAMRLAQSRGHEIRCYVPMIAASMGFQILAMCDKRYALRNALLLWHPMKTSLRNADSAILLYESKRLQAWEVPFINELLKALKISMRTFSYHRQNETLWMAYEFAKMSPGFLTVADDFKGVKDIFADGSDDGGF